VNPDQLGLDFGPEAPEPDFPAVRRPLGLDLEALARMKAAYERVPVPRVKFLYKVSLGGGAMAPLEMWEWSCPVCPYMQRDHDKAALQVRVDRHRCRARESLNWHPRYRMPPRW
jgi:hypothetical protein